ncbi:MAG: mechanosensitive ion channel family protein [Caulobacter sp.]|nr:mechanosensitive ion channel family protein [Caulobacter sp.]
MPPTLLPAVALLAVIVVGVLGLRPFAKPIRLAVDLILFLIISLALAHLHATPLFPPLHGRLNEPLHAAGLWLRAIAGAWWFLGARILVAGLGWALAHRPRKARARLLSDLVAGGIYLATGLLVLNSVFALPITGLVATSGVVAIVLGFALQSTLSDVFAGVAVGIEAPFAPGDRIRIDDGVEGEVTQINWRSIHVQVDGEDVAILPHSAVAKATIINRSVPTGRRSLSIEVPCPAAAAPERVIDVLAQASQLCPAILSTPAPAVRLVHLGGRWNRYEVTFCVADSSVISATKSALRVNVRRQLHFAGLLDTENACARRRLLREAALFESLSDDQIAHLTDQVTTQFLEAGEALFEQGACDASLYMIAAGILEFHRHRGRGPAEVLGCIGAGDYVGEIGLLTGAPHAATAVARTGMTVHRLDSEALAPLLHADLKLAAALDRSARRGLELLERGIAAQASEIQDSASLLARITTFFRPRATPR